MHALVFIMQLSAVSQWVEQNKVGDISVAIKAVPGSSYEAIRVIAHSVAPPDIQAEEIWGPSTKESLANKNSIDVHTVLEDSPNKRVYYQTVKVPVFSARDYVLQLERSVENNVHTIKFQSIPDARYPVKEEFVRMTTSGHSRTEPAAEGGSTITYELFVDLQGSVPAFIARGAQRDSAVEWIKVMVARGAARMAEKKAK